MVLLQTHFIIFIFWDKWFCSCQPVTDVIDAKNGSGEGEALCTCRIWALIFRALSWFCLHRLFWPAQTHKPHLNTLAAYRRDQSDIDRRMKVTDSCVLCFLASGSSGCSEDSWHPAADASSAVHIKTQITDSSPHFCSLKHYRFFKNNHKG